MNSKGFTLIEIIVVIAIVGVLAGMAAVSYSGMTKDYEIESVKEQLIQTLKNTRTEAVARNRTVDFVEITSGNYTICWYNGGTPVTITNNISFGLQNSNIKLRFNNLTGTRVTFDNWGKVSNASGGTPSITISKGTLSRTVTIETTGYIH